MKYVKMFGLAAIAAAALMAFVGAGTASATVLCNNNLSTSSCSSKVATKTTITAKSVGKSVLATKEGTVLDECENSTLEGEVEKAGGSAETVSGPLTKLNWGNCTRTTNTTELGRLEIHWISGTDNGTLTVVGTKVTVDTGFFGSCVFTASDIGTLVGGNPAKISLKEQKVSRVTGLCPSEVLWTAEFEVTKPNPLYVASA
jgi:hypothetical protein